MDEGMFSGEALNHPHDKTSSTKRLLFSPLKSGKVEIIVQIVIKENQIKSFYVRRCKVVLEMNGNGCKDDFSTESPSCGLSRTLVLS